MGQVTLSPPPVTSPRGFLAFPWGFRVARAGVNRSGPGDSPRRFLTSPWPFAMPLTVESTRTRRAFAATESAPQGTASRIGPRLSGRRGIVRSLKKSPMTREEAEEIKRAFDEAMAPVQAAMDRAVAIAQQIKAKAKAEAEANAARSRSRAQPGDGGTDP
jgi:hypothetical protein